MNVVKINKSAIDSQQISNTPEPAPKQEAKKTSTFTELQSGWSSFVSKDAEQGGAIDPNALVQEVLRESYVQTTEDLRFYAEKVKYFNECKKEVRDHLSKLRDYDKDLKPQVDSLKAGKAIDSNVMETLLRTIKETVNDSNEDKKYYLGKLDSLNKIATDLAQQQQTISDASERLAAKEKKDDGDD
ncbi:MAG TPA: hypothetical protein VH815_16215 [Acidobacteriota bacterium]